MIYMSVTNLEPLAEGCVTAQYYIQPPPSLALFEYDSHHKILALELGVLALVS